MLWLRRGASIAEEYEALSRKRNSGKKRHQGFFPRDRSRTAVESRVLGPVNLFSTSLLEALIRASMDPDEVAEKVVHGIRENELFIFSHPEWRSTVEEHFQRMLAAYPQA